MLDVKLTDRANVSLLNRADSVLPISDILACYRQTAIQIFDKQRSM